MDVIPFFIEVFAKNTEQQSSKMSVIVIGYWLMPPVATSCTINGSIYSPYVVSFVLKLFAGSIIHCS